MEKETKEIARENKNRQALRKQKAREKKRNKIKPVRLIPIWLRLIIVTIVFLISIASGLMFGYGVIGDGNAIDAITRAPWQHIYDIIYKGVN